MLAGRPRWPLLLGLGLFSAVVSLAGLQQGPWPLLEPLNSSQGGDRLLQALLETDQRPTPGSVEDRSPPTGLKRSSVEPTVPSSPPPQAHQAPAALPLVRVALFRQFPLRSLEARGNSHCQDRQGKGYRTIDIQGWTGSSLRCQSFGSGAIVVNGLGYQGTIELVRSGNGWLPINQLDLEHYVASVVGAEMPSHWGREALKAQAVAARSYALVHLVRPANARYHLGDTTRWQVYGGQASMTQSTLEAAQATQGEVLSFRGGLVESLYAATASISAEAHGHLGASMSQTGAHALAQQGHSYAQILDRYYKGAELARITPNGP